MYSLLCIERKNEKRINFPLKLSISVLLQYLLNIKYSKSKKEKLKNSSPISEEIAVSRSTKT